MTRRSGRVKLNTDIDIITFFTKKTNLHEAERKIIETTLPHYYLEG